MKIAVTGANGLIGQALVSLAQASGVTVVPIVRQAKADLPAQAVVWAWDQGETIPDSLNGLDGLVHLAGESITGRWTPAKKEAIRQSREQGTQRLVTGLLSLAQPPQVVVSASAIGYYGERGDQSVNEQDGPSIDFLSQVAQAWEAATEPLDPRGIRRVNARFGIVLSTRGGALQAMMPPFQLGAGGVVGNGHQYWSWVALPDVARALMACLEKPELQGPVNVVAPWPVTNQGFTKAMGMALNRPTIIPMPAFAARLVLGEMADALLLTSTRVEPKKLLATGFQFHHTELEPTLRALLKQKI